MELRRLNPAQQVLIRCPAGCLHLHTFDLLALHPDTRGPQLLIPYIATTPPHPN
ncbi:MAG: hypothetical protein AB7I38_14335 [Dehalococcoidia bacterium]